MEVVVRQEVVEQALPEDETERMILESMGDEPVHVDLLTEICALPVSKINASLAMLELKGRVRKLSGMQYIKVRERSAAYQSD